MIKVVAIILSIVLIVVISEYDYTESISKTDYVKYFRTLGDSYLKITVASIGEKEVDNKPRHFYKICFENLSNEDIILKEVHYEMDFGTLQSTEVNYKDHFIKKYGTNIIEASETICRDDSYVYARKSGNSLIKTFIFDYSRGEGEVSIRLLYP